MRYREVRFHPMPPSSLWEKSNITHLMPKWFQVNWAEGRTWKEGWWCRKHQPLSSDGDIFYSTPNKAQGREGAFLTPKTICPSMRSDEEFWSLLPISPFHASFLQFPSPAAGAGDTNTTSSVGMLSLLNVLSYANHSFRGKNRISHSGHHIGTLWYWCEVSHFSDVTQLSEKKKKKADDGFTSLSFSGCEGSKNLPHVSFHWLLPRWNNWESEWIYN